MSRIGGRPKLAGALVLFTLTSAAFGGGLPSYSPPPLVTTDAWFDWYNALLASRIADVSFPRAQTRYISSTLGDDGNDGLSPSSPWATVAKANAWINSAGGETREVLFRRGDAWHVRAGLITSKVGVRIADYGDPADPRPYLSGFAEQFPSGGGGWTNLAPPNQNVYSRVVADEVFWVRQDGDADLDSPLNRRNSVVGTQAVQGSWWYDTGSGTLYVHPRGGVDADSVDLEACTALENGVLVQGDLSLVENIRADGWGMNSLQKENLQARVKNADRAVFRNCEAYYSSSHVISHFVGNGLGGVATFIDCTAGFTKWHNAGETIFNSYAKDGEQETIFHNCTVARGTLPSVEATTKRAQAFFGHTSNLGPRIGLAVVYGCRILEHDFGCAGVVRFDNAPDAPTLADARIFIVGVEHEGGEQTGSASSRLFQDGNVTLNSTYRFKPEFINTQAFQNRFVDGWFINSTLDFDASNQTANWFGLYNTTSSSNKPRIWNSAILVRNIPAGVEVRIDADGPGSSPQGVMQNSIFARISGPGTLVANLPDNAANVFANAYYSVTAPSADTNAVVLASPPVVEPPAYTSPLVGAASPLLPGGIDLEFDQQRSPRTNDTIGPFESLRAGDIDGNGVVNGADLAALLGGWGTASAALDLNGDGVVNGVDLALLLGNWGD